MKITVIGAGGAFAGLQRGNSSFLVEEGDRRVLIDCGMTTPYILRDEMGVALESITDVVITHAHSDHAGGLELLLHACRWIGKTKPTVWCSSGVAFSLSHLLSHLRYEADGFKSTNWFDHHAELRSGLWFEDGPLGLGLELFTVQHVGLMPATAVRLGPLAVSGDTCKPVVDLAFWKGAKLVLHEAEFGFATGVHCPVLDLASVCLESLPADAEVWAYHCPADAGAPAPLKGVLQKGQVFHLD